MHKGCPNDQVNKEAILGTGWRSVYLSAYIWKVVSGLRCDIGLGGGRKMGGEETLSLHKTWGREAIHIHIRMHAHTRTHENCSYTNTINMNIT